MNIDKIQKEIKSPALKEIAGSLVEVINGVRSGDIDAKTASVAVAGHKHVLQSIAIDWMYSSPKTKMIAVQA